jgi:hypothetical protein
MMDDALKLSVALTFLRGNEYCGKRPLKGAVERNEAQRQTIGSAS